MAFNGTNPVIVGATAKANQYTRAFNNTTALYEGALALPGQTALDLFYAIDGESMGRIPKGTGLQIPRLNSGATAYEFHTPPLPVSGQTALDFLFALSSTAIGRVAAGTALQMPRINAAGNAWEFASILGSATLFTPYLIGSGGTSGQSYTTQTGYYLRIGQLVICFINIQINSAGSVSGDAQISGLPVVSKSIAPAGFAFFPYWANFGTAVAQKSGLVDAAATTCRIYQNAGILGTSAIMPASQIANSCVLQGIVAYFSD